MTLRMILSTCALVTIVPCLLQPAASEKIEEEFTVARLYISKMKSEVKTLVTRCGQLETYQTDTNKKLEDRENELSEAKLLIQQHEAKMKTVAETMKENEEKKRHLEDSVDTLNEECARLKAQGKLPEYLHQFRPLLLILRQLSIL